MAAERLEEARKAARIESEGSWELPSAAGSAGSAEGAAPAAAAPAPMSGPAGSASGQAGPDAGGTTSGAARVYHHAARREERLDARLLEKPHVYAGEVSVWREWKLKFVGWMVIVDERYEMGLRGGTLASID